MTFKEKYMQDHPEAEKSGFDLLAHCPEAYGYEEYSCETVGCSRNSISCKECWDREIPEEENKPKEWKCVDCVFRRREEDCNMCMAGDIEIECDGVYECGQYKQDLCADCTLLKMDGDKKTCPNVDRKFTEKVVECVYHKEFLERLNDLVDEINKEEETGEFTKKLNIPTIKDSGARREFETGAVRDIQEGKGRCDLLPLDAIAEYYTKYLCFPNCGIEPINAVLNDIYEFQNTGSYAYLFQVLRDTEIFTDNFETAILEVSKHFEEGAKKYGEYNWQKGIPTHCYIDSAVRHYLKHLRGDKDEPHDRAFVWNILCCIWTCIHKPELNDYSKKEV